MSQIILKELKLNSAVKYVAREGLVNNFPITFAYDNPTQLQVFVGFKRVPEWELKTENGLPSVALPEDLKIGQSITIRRATPADGVPHTYQYKGNAQGGAEFNAMTIDENFEYMAKIVSEVEDYNAIAQDNLNDVEDKFKETQDIANDAKDLVDRAMGVADNAEQVALGIDTKAQVALDTSQDASNTADMALTISQGIDGKAQEALETSRDSMSIAEGARDTAQGVDAKAQEALNTSGNALSIATNALSTASDAKSTAEGIDGKADLAISTAQGAETVAQEALDLVDSKLEKSKNLSDLTDVTVARSNLGLGSSATLNKTDVLGTSSTLIASQKLVNDTKIVLDNKFNNLTATISVTGDPVEIYKSDLYAPVFAKESSDSIKVKPNTYVRVEGNVVNISDQVIKLTNKLAGNDYVVTVDSSGNLNTYLDKFEEPATIPSGNYIIGGFFYSEIPENETVASGEFATSGAGMVWTQTDVDNIRGINKFSIWDLRFRSGGFISSPMSVRYNSLSNHGMVFDSTTNRWYAIYHINSDVDQFGVSRSGTDIASGTVTPKVPSAFGGDGTKKYNNLNWWVASELVKSQGSRLLWEFEFNSRAFGTTENKVAGGSSVTYPKTERIKGLTSKIGCEQVTGVQWYWGLDSSYRPEGSGWSWKNETGGRGQLYTYGTYGLVRAIFGGTRGDVPADVGSRASIWHSFPWSSGWDVGAVASRDLLIL